MFPKYFTISLIDSTPIEKSSTLPNVSSYSPSKDAEITNEMNTNEKDLTTNLRYAWDKSPKINSSHEMNKTDSEKKFHINELQSSDDKADTSTENSVEENISKPKPFVYSLDQSDNANRSLPQSNHSLPCANNTFYNSFQTENFTCSSPLNSQKITPQKLTDTSEQVKSQIRPPPGFKPIPAQTGQYNQFSTYFNNGHQATPIVNQLNNQQILNSLYTAFLSNLNMNLMGPNLLGNFMYGVPQCGGNILNSLSQMYNMQQIIQSMNQQLQMNPQYGSQTTGNATNFSMGYPGTLNPQFANQTEQNAANNPESSSNPPRFYQASQNSAYFPNDCSNITNQYTSNNFPINNLNQSSSSYSEKTPVDQSFSHVKNTVLFQKEKAQDTDILEKHVETKVPEEHTLFDRNLTQSELIKTFGM